MTSSDASAAGYDPHVRSGPEHARRPHRAAASERFKRQRQQQQQPPSFGHLVFGTRRHGFPDQNERVVAEERSEEAVRLVAEYDLLVADYDLNYDLPVYDQLVFDFLVVDYDLGIGV